MKISVDSRALTTWAKIDFDSKEVPEARRYAQAKEYMHHVVHPKGLKQGQLAVIVEWAGNTSYIGLTVHMNRGRLDVLGGKSGTGWDSLEKLDPRCLVRKLLPGDVLTIQEEEA